MAACNLISCKMLLFIHSIKEMPLIFFFCFVLYAYASCNLTICKLVCYSFTPLKRIPFIVLVLFYMLGMSLSYYMIKKAMLLGMSINCLAHQG